MSGDHYVCYLFVDATNAKFPRRTGPFGAEAADSLARELSRREQISEVVVEKWEAVERRVVK